MKKKTQKQRIIDQFKLNGYVTNFWALENKILRLASSISNLRKEGWYIRTKYKGVIGHKNCFYYLERKPIRMIKLPIFNDNGTVTLVNREVELF